MKYFLSIRFSDPKYNHRGVYVYDLVTVCDVASTIIASMEDLGLNLLSFTIQTTK